VFYWFVGIVAVLSVIVLVFLALSGLIDGNGQ
jgi:hypothetical protein